MTTWADLETMMADRYGGRYRWRNGSNRAWWVPCTYGGHLTVEVTLRRRWCSLAIDRWHTTDRDPAVSKPWLEAHIWPKVQAALARRKPRGWGVLPAGATFAAARPVDREELVDVLTLWVDAELIWPGVTCKEGVTR
jgi:hypothetical protein